MALQCTAGLIAVQDIIDAVNENETGITTNESNITQNRTDIDSNDVELSDHISRIITLENNSVTNGDISALEARVGVNEANIGTNTGNITTNTADIVTNTNSIVGLDTRVGINEVDIATNTQNIDTLTTTVGNQAVDIADNRTDIDTLLAATGTGKHAIYAHEEVTGINGGTPTLGWDARNIGTVRENSLGGALQGVTSYKILEDGEYKITAAAVADGAYHQSRIVAGSQIAYGSSQKGYGESIVVAEFTMLANEDIAIQTRVNTPAAGDLGLGESTPFGETNVYVQLQIEKVG